MSNNFSRSARDFGNCPDLPHNDEAERAVMGAIILDNTAYNSAAQILSCRDFFLESHCHIFDAMISLAKENQAIDLVTLVEELTRRGNLESVGGAAYVSSLPDGMPRSANIKYYLQVVKEKSELRRYAREAEAIRELSLKPDSSSAEIYRRLRGLTDNLAPVKTAGLVVVPVEELLTRDIKPCKMLLDPILPEQGLAMLYAYRGIGKTHLALGIAGAVASGAPFLRWTAPRPRRVLYVDGELPATTIREWAAMILAGFDEAELAPDTLRIVTPDLQERPMPDLSTVEGQCLLEPHLEGIDLVVLDNLSALCRYGKENEGEDWLPVQEWALGLRRRGMAVLFVHHAGKDKSQRGTSRREDMLNTVITLKHPTDYDPSEGLRCEVHFEKTRSMLGDAAKPFEVRMENGLDGRAIWTWRELEDARAQQAAGFFSSGMSVREVAEELGISKSTAQRLRGRWTSGEFGEASRRPNT
jgi:hypothetical protein